jgi:hypothetical protein
MTTAEHYVAAHAGSATAAAGRAMARTTTHLHLPGVGHVQLPPSKQLGFVAGVAALTALGLIEWPVAAALGIGHLLASDHSNELVRSFGEALEEA